MPVPNYAYREIKRKVGKALHRYDMIADGERIAVGMSGGKDSLVLMWILQERLARIPISYELFAIHIDPGFEGGYREELAAYCERMGFRLHVAVTDHGLVAHSEENRENPCFLCSRLRRKRLFEMADELGCRKLALAHHKDDIIETLLMNMCYAGEISSMMPFQSFFKGKFAIIRPLSYVDEETISRFSRGMGFPAFENPCPSAKRSKRGEIKQMLQQLYRSNSKIKGNLFQSMSRVKMEYLMK